MATVTSTPTGGTLMANKNKEVKGTISWSKPTVPSGATISSCVLTGKATVSMSKGSATVTVNGTTVTSGTQFTINLGTANDTTSVSTSIKGANNQASGSVSFSELLYTVTYTEQVVKPTYTVTFKDWDGTTLKTQTVEEGSSATAPSNPSRDGYNFTGWDKSFNNITANVTITAQYSIKTYTVIFKDDDGSTLKTQNVNHGSAATAPSDPSKEGYTFIGWDKDFSNVTSDLIVTAQYKKEVMMIEWTGLGTIATNLKAHAGDEDYFHDSYKVNLDWNNESFDIIITGELNRNNSYFYNLGNIGDIEIGDNKLSIVFSDGTITIYHNNIDDVLEYYNSDYMSFPFVVSLTKNGIYAKSSTPTGEYSTLEFLPGSENMYEFNQPIYLIDDGLIHSSVSSQENPNYNVTFDLAVSERPNEDSEPEIPEGTPVEKTIALRPISATQDSGYNNAWTNIANTYDTDTSTSGTIIVTGSSQSGFKRKYVDTIFNFDNPIPANATINSAVLTIRAKQSATTNLNITASIGSQEVISSTLLSSSSANYTADIANYVKDLNQLNINLTSAATSNRTFTLYDVRIDVDYTAYEMPEEPEKQLIAEYKFDNTIYDLFPEFNEGFTYTYEDAVEGEVTTRIIYSDNLPTKIRFSTCSTNGQGCDGRELALLEILYLNNNNLLAESQMFHSCVNLTKVEGFTSNVMKNTNHMFCSCRSLTSLDLSNWNVNNVTDIEYMFYKCESLTSLDLSNWDVSNATSMSCMFAYCDSLTSLDLSNWNVSNVTEMYYMFDSCELLTTLDLSNWDVSNVTDMEGMFYECPSLTSLNLSNWDVSNVTTISDVFYNCNKLRSIAMNNSDYNSVNKVIVELPIRSSDSKGTLNILGIDDINQIDITTSESKFWNVVGEEKDENIDNIVLGSNIIENMYIGNDRIIQMYLNGQPLM